MSTRSFRVLSDYIRHGMNVEVICPADHRSILAAQPLYQYFIIRRWPYAVHEVPQHLRCSVCRQRAMAIKPTPRDPEPTDFFPKDKRGWDDLIRRLRN